MIHASIIHRALFHLGYFLILWTLAGFICFRWITDPFMTYLFGSVTTLLSAGSGLLLFLDPIEKERLGNEQKRQFEMLKILSEIFECDINEIRGRSRFQNHVDARGVFVYMLRIHSKMRLTSIADLIDRDHTSVIHLVKRTEDLLFTKHERITEAVEKIKTKLFNQ